MSWPEEDQTIALVWAQAERSKCGRCGTWEWEHEEGKWEADHYTCEGCRQLDAHIRTVQNSPGSHDGVKVGLFMEDA